MHHVLTELGLRLTYLRDSGSINDLDQERILDDLAEGTPAGEPPVWSSRAFLSDYDHLVLATALDTGQVLGLLGARDIGAGAGGILLLETGFVIGPARGANLLRRMIALALLRIAGLGTLPGAIATLTNNPVGCHILRAMGRTLRGARFAPAPDATVVHIEDAQLIRRIAASLGQPARYGMTLEALQTATPAANNRLRRLSPNMRMEHVFAPARLTAEPMLAALDLRGTAEVPLLADARRLYRAKGRRSPIHALPAVERNPFWPAARPVAPAVGIGFGS